jgi:hypothetical protein
MRIWNTLERMFRSVSSVCTSAVASAACANALLTNEIIKFNYFPTLYQKMGTSMRYPLIPVETCHGMSLQNTNSQIFAPFLKAPSGHVCPKRGFIGFPKGKAPGEGRDP